AISVLLDVKDIPQVGPLQWGWIICVQDAFAKKVFGVGRDSVSGALASVLRKRSTEGRTPDAVRPTSTANLPVLHGTQDAADDFARCRAIEIIVITRRGRARSR